MEPSTDLQEPDEARPAKRVRLEAPLGITEDVQEEIADDDDWDSIYGNADDGGVAVNTVDGAEEEVPAPATSEQPVPESSDRTSTLPSELAAKKHVEQAQAAAEQEREKQMEVEVEVEVEDGVPADAIDDGEEFVAEQEHVVSTDEPSSRMLDDTVDVDTGEAPEIEMKEDGEAAGDAEAQTAGTEDEGTTDEISACHAVTSQAPYSNKSFEELRTADYAQGTTHVNTNGQADSTEHTSADQNGALEAPTTNGGAAQTQPKPADDPEFLEAASAQKANGEAEWQFSPSDAESSSGDISDSDSDSGSSSSSDSEGGYEMLDPATAAKMLMSGDGDDDDGDKSKGKGGGDHQPRTTNEVTEQTVPKPNVTVTEDMNITFLGTVDRTVTNLLLIKAVTTGEYQVLESGSVLCTADRSVIGAVAETLGRVQEPMYSVAFTNAQEIEDAGLVYGTKVFYVDAHSTFVFTQPLKGMKGTDASNIHDEEVGEEELEFSDDEKEAEFKRLRKAAKRGGRGGLSRSTFNEEREGRSFGAPGHDSGMTYVDQPPPPQQQGYMGGGLSYDDDDASAGAGAGGGGVQEEFYSPLKRPENLSQMMAGSGLPPRPQLSGGAAPPRPPQQGGFERGRGRGRGDRGGRGRGERGRGRGGSQRGGRGGGGGYVQDGGSRGGGYTQDGRSRGDFGQQNGHGDAQHRGNAHSFPDRHNHDGAVNGYGRGQSQTQHSLPPRLPQHASSPPLGLSSQQQHYPTYQSQASSPPQGAPQTYQFNGYTFSYGNAPPGTPGAPGAPQTQQQSYYSQQTQPPLPPTPGGSIPAGACVNPAFFQGQQQQGWPASQQQQQGYGGWPQQQQYAQPGAAPGGGYGGGGAGGAQQQQAQQQQQSNLADILRQLGGRQQ